MRENATPSKNYRKKHKEPLIRITKRNDFSKGKATLIYTVAIIIALILCVSIIKSITGAAPLDVMKAVWSGAFGENVFSRSFWTTLRDTMLLFCVALGLTLAFKMRFWNIGAEGQILVGGLITAIIMLFLAGKMPQWLMFTIMVASSLLAGAIWGLIPAIFKARWKANETLFTLMMNYIATQLVAFCNIIWEKKEGSGVIGIINAYGAEHYGEGWISTNVGESIFGSGNYLIITVTVILLAFAVDFYIKRTKHGYELSVVGESENTAKYAGISVNRVIIRTMLISGAVCGLVGFMVVSGSSHTISVSTAGGRGFTAIIVSWLGKFNVYYMALVAFLLVFLNVGASEIATNFGLNQSMSDVLVGIIIFFILASDFFINYRIVIRSKEARQ